MTKFYVGQRVRIKYSINWPELAGQEGRVIERCQDGGESGSSDWRVSPDCWGSFVSPNFGLEGYGIFAPNSDQLEPITDPGHEVTTWAECAWKPPHLRGVEA